MLLLLFGYLLVIMLWWREYAIHKKNLKRLPIRIQVNGTRGKSSVTRLIAAGLRGGGMSVISKTTGTLPRFQIDNRTEFPIRRLGQGNIIEEVRIVKEAVKRKPDALVIECMALIPEYQRIEREKLIQPTIGVITNVRADHLDVMGPTILDVAYALTNTVPRGGYFFTAEKEFLWVFEKRAREMNTKVIFTSPEEVKDEEMDGFTYLEHKENVALALAVCQHLGIKREDALFGMKNSIPDPGVLRVYKVREGNKEIRLINALAANDPDSSKKIAEMVFNKYAGQGTLILLVNLRADRQDRSRQLGEIANQFGAEYIVITGKVALPFIKMALKAGVKETDLINLEETPPPTVYEKIFSLVEKVGVVLAIGNMVGYGQELINYFAQKGREDDY